MKPNKTKPFISVYFKCCKVYQRIYLNKTGEKFVGWCPKCTRKVTAVVSPDGTTDTTFVAE